LVDYFVLIMLANIKKFDNILLIECEEKSICTFLKSNVTKSNKILQAITHFLT
jgi:hypothetical protein